MRANYRRDKKFKEWLQRNYFINLDLRGHVRDEVRKKGVNLNALYEQYKRETALPTLKRRYEFAYRLSPPIYDALWHFRYIDLYNLSGRLFYKQAIEKIRKDNPKTIDEALDYVYDFNYWALTLAPEQIWSEYWDLLQIVQKHKPKAVLEIGTEKGGSFLALTRACEDDALMISIDLDNKRKWKHKLIESFGMKELGMKRQKVYAIETDSHDHETAQKVIDLLNVYGKEGLDFIFIDGDHTYNGVKKDFLMYSQLLNNDGIIAFHDIMKHPVESHCEVDRFWEEIKGKYKHEELVESPKSWAGIGVIFKGK